MKFSLTSLFKKKPHTIHAPSILRPTHMWHMILTLSFVLVLIAGALSWYLYIQIVRDEAFKASPKSPSNSALIKHSKLNEVLTEYKERETKFNELKEAAPVIQDPSL
jgi:hypothetical protein